MCDYGARDHVDGSHLDTEAFRVPTDDEVRLIREYFGIKDTGTETDVQ